MVMALISRATHRTSLAVEAARAWLRLVLVKWSAVSILMLAHLVEVAIWAATYRMLDLTPQPFDSFYFAFVNYTTLGYGDILPAQRWRLLGPITAMNGVLLFGWSAAVIYGILRTIAGIISTQPQSPPRWRARPAIVQVRSVQVIDHFDREVLRRFHDRVWRYPHARRSNAGTVGARPENERLRPKSGRRTYDSGNNRDTDKLVHVSLHLGSRKGSAGDGGRL